MIKLCAVVAFVAVATAHYVPGEPDKVVADKDFLTKEKAILQLLHHVQQPLYTQDLLEIAQHYKPMENKDMYKEEDLVWKFWKTWEAGMFLKKGEEFSPMDFKHGKQAFMLTSMMVNAKDWDTFYKTAIWSRQYMNEGMFLFSLSVAMNARTDTKNLILPEMYDIVPHMFIRSEIMQKAYETRMKSNDKKEKSPVVIFSNFTEWLHSKMNPEMRMTYFTEDLSLNAWNWDMQTKIDMSPMEVDSEKSEMLKYKSWMWILSRYNLERMSNNLADIKKFKLNEEMPGFAPHLRWKNGKEIPMRPAHMKMTDTIDVEMVKIKEMEETIRTYVEKYPTMKDIKLKKTAWKTYWALFNKLMNLAGRVVDPMKEFDMAPGALMYHETQLRDPLYYRILKRAIDLCKKPKWNLKKTEKSDLLLPGVKIENLETDKLMTFYETFDIELNNGMVLTSEEDEKKNIILARHTRINHKAFNYRVMIDSKEDMKVKVSVFLTPKRDANGLELSWEDKIHNLVEIDEFKMDLKSGENKMQRNSMDFPFYMAEKDSYKTLLKKVDDAIQGKAPMYIKNTKEDMVHYPAHLLLPKGKKNGMPYSMIVLVSKIDEQDTLAHEYTLEDKLNVWDFKMPNLFEKEVIIYHKKTDETYESI